MNFANTSGRLTITGRDGSSYRVDSCLVAKSRKPRGGWHVTFELNGQSVKVTGPTSDAVFKATKALFLDNSVELPDSELWLNLNIQWLERSIEKYQQVTLADLLQVSAPVEVEATPATLMPQGWLLRVWSILEIYLAQKEYHHAKFTEVLHLVRDISNPDNSLNFSGNSAVYIVLSLHYSKIQADPLYSQDEARQRLVDIRREISQKVGVPTLTFDQVATLNNWTP